jgi:hypothetical protein
MRAVVADDARKLALFLHVQAWNREHEHVTLECHR